MNYTFESVMKELQALGKERTKKIYLAQGAKEPIFGVATGAMKPMSRAIKTNQDLANQLYDSGNYDAMYFAGIIADPQAMTEADFEAWMDQAYFYMISDYVVAVTLTESPLNLTLADKWIASNEELRQSAGWSTYIWSLGRWKDDTFSKERIHALLKQASQNIQTAPNRTKYSMSNFIHTVGLSYLPLHKEAMEIAANLGEIKYLGPNQKEITLTPYLKIQKDKDKGRIGFKRKYVRC